MRICQANSDVRLMTRVHSIPRVPNPRMPLAARRLRPAERLRFHVQCHVYSLDDERPSAEMSEEERAAEILTGTTKKIKMLGQQGRMKDAIAALAGLADLGVQPDTLAATTLVRACVKDMVLAQSVFDELFGSNDFLQPDEVTFAVLLRGYGSRNPPDWSSIDTVLTTMRTKFGITPTATSFNPLLEVCSRNNDLDRGQDVIDRMAADGVEPDEFSMEVVAKRKVLRSYLKKTFGI